MSGPDRDLRRVRDFLSGDAPPVRTLGKYNLLRELGRGGMGVVHEAYDPALKRRVALKILKDDDPRFVARLFREASIAAQLRHPNIVGVHEVAVEPTVDGRSAYFIAMEFIEGRTLADLMQEGRTPPSELLRILEDTARAAGFAHGKGIVHRDLKPANVLVETGGRVLLTDFGLAHAETFVTQLTKSHAVMGTPQYMAPEQVEGRTRDIGPRTDVYALGVMLYEILAGRPPFVSETPAQLYQHIVQDEPTRPSRFGRAVDRDLELICLKAIDKERGRRYEDATQFAEDLSRFRRGEPVQARPPSLLYRIRKGFRRRRMLAGAGLLVATVLALGLAVSGAARRASVRRLLEDAAAHEAAGRSLEARDAYQRALGLDPGNAEAGSGFARLKEAIDRRELDEREAAKLIEEGRIWIDRAEQVLYKPGASYRDLVERVEKARSLIDLAVEKAPRMVSAHYHLGRAWEIGGWEDQAEASWRRAVELDPEFGLARYRLGRLLLSRAFLRALIVSTSTGEESEQRFGKSLEAAREGAAEIDLALRSTRGLEDDLHRTVARAMLAYTERRFPEALALARDGAARLDGRDGVEELWWLTALATSDPAEEMSAYDRAIGLKPNEPLALFGRGNRHFSAHRLPEALKDFDRAIEFRPRFGPALVNRGNARLREGDLPGALADFNAAIEADSRIALAWNSRGIYWLMAGDLARAEKDFTTSIELNGARAEAWCNRGRVRAEAGRRAEALADFTKAIECDRDYVLAYTPRGLILLDQGDLDAAAADFTETIRLKPERPLAWASRGRARFLQGRLAEAEKDLVQALDVAPADWRERRRSEELLGEIRRRSRDR